MKFITTLLLIIYLIFLSYKSFESKHNMNIMFYKDIMNIDNDKFASLSYISIFKNNELFRNMSVIDDLDPETLNFLDKKNIDYLLYQSLDKYYFIDNGLEECNWQDPIYFLFLKLFYPWRINNKWIDGASVKPGSIIHFGGNSNPGLNENDISIEIIDSKLNILNKTISSHDFNCIRKQYTAKLDTTNFVEGDYRIIIKNKGSILDSYEFKIDNSGIVIDNSKNFKHFQKKYYTYDQVINRLKNSYEVLKYDKNGIGFILLKKNENLQ